MTHDYCTSTMSAVVLFGSYSSNVCSEVITRGRCDAITLQR